MKFVKNGMISILLVCMLMVMSACGSNEAGKDAANANDVVAVELTVSAAASLTEALNELKEKYEAQNEGVTLLFNYGASGALQQQIEQGAPADLFISAALKNMDALVEKGLVEKDNRVNLLSNELVVVSPKDSALKIASNEDLLQDTVAKIAIGIPESVPAGKYAEEALKKAGLWDKLQPKSVQAKDVKQVLQYVETGNVDAGFVYKTDALSSDAVQIAFQVDAASYSPILYPIGIVKASKHQTEAKALYDYLQGEEAQGVFAKYGFGAPK
ncbi:molybdate ABC transporter substrate-binding protein [Paenibacillus sp. GCM10027627]|uniref:molybdate ABC transporter substrate-binding protein n=1 Tax=unclassified Paenibacillus TaxID=185978 RepID=UPI0036368B91